mgnify:CR=1 FL=1
MTDVEVRTLLAERLGAVELRIAEACRLAGRERSAVTLVAVTKTVSSRVAGLLPELGVLDLGENRPQELWRKAEALQHLPIRWHFIGHLQRNKIERTLPCVHLFHSVDSLRLLEALATTKAVTRPRVLLQLNSSREEQKGGFAYETLLTLEETIAKLPLAVVGLMGMAANTDDPALVRATFAELRQFRERLRTAWPILGPRLEYLSMGMSGDFEVAIAEGATHIRLGSTLFNGLEAES